MIGFHLAALSPHRQFGRVPGPASRRSFTRPIRRSISEGGQFPVAAREHAGAFRIAIESFSSYVLSGRFTGSAFTGMSTVTAWSRPLEQGASDQMLPPVTAAVVRDVVDLEERVGRSTVARDRPIHRVAVRASTDRHRTPLDAVAQVGDTQALTLADRKLECVARARRVSQRVEGRLGLRAARAMDVLAHPLEDLPRCLLVARSRALVGLRPRRRDEPVHQCSDDDAE